MHYGLGKSGIPELAGGDIDGDTDIPAGRPLPTRRRPAGLLENPLADRRDQAGFLRQRDEAIRHHHAQCGVVPAQQRFDSTKVAGIRIHDGLKVELEFLLLQGAPQT